MAPHSDQIKCVVVGDESVGKTSLLMNYATNRFPSQHVPALFDNYAGSIAMRGRQYTMQLIDTLDTEYENNRRHIYPGTHVFVVCFSVINPESFRNLQRKWLPGIRELVGGETPFIIAGTHADLRNDDTVLCTLGTKHERPVTTREATALSRRLGSACYIECSPVMKKRLRRVMNDAFLTVFCDNSATRHGCVIL